MSDDAPQSDDKSEATRRLPAGLWWKAPIAVAAVVYVANVAGLFTPSPPLPLCDDYDVKRFVREIFNQKYAKRIAPFNAVSMKNIREKYYQEATWKYGEKRGCYITISTNAETIYDQEILVEYIIGEDDNSDAYIVRLLQY